MFRDTVVERKRIKVINKSSFRRLKKTIEENMVHKGLFDICLEFNNGDVENAYLSLYLYMIHKGIKDFAVMSHSLNTIEGNVALISGNEGDVLYYVGCSVMIYINSDQSNISDIKKLLAVLDFAIRGKHTSKFYSNLEVSYRSVEELLKIYDNHVKDSILDIDNYMMLREYEY